VNGVILVEKKSTRPKRIYGEKYLKAVNFESICCTNVRITSGQTS